MTKRLSIWRVAFCAWLGFAWQYAVAVDLSTQSAQSFSPPGMVSGNPPPTTPAAAVDPSSMPAGPVVAVEDGMQPFGANLFTGNFLRTREDGLNPNYVVARGDQVAVYAWGAVEVSGLFTVDAQGNIFLPGIGPVKVEGVRNANLSQAVRKKIRDIYIDNFNVYTNLVTSQPVLVYVTGAVRHPGRYAGLPNDTLLYFLDLAGGIDPDLGSYRQIDVLRNGRVLSKVDLYDFLLNGKIPRVVMREGDTILVRKRGPQVELDGDVARPSLIELTPDAKRGRHLLEVVPQAAGAVEVSLEGYRDGRPYNRTLPVAHFADLEVMDGDRVVVSDAGLSPTVVVKIEGEHSGPPFLSVRRGARLIDVLNVIEVDPELANVHAVHLYRPSVARAQKESINDSLLRLERDSLLALSKSSGEVDIRAKEAELVTEFIERARLIEPLGRVVTVRDGVQQNIPIEPNDTIVIPRKSDVVRVSGQVVVPQALVHKPGSKVSDYIAMSGGYAARADKDGVLLLKPSAEVARVSLDMEIAPGDEILVLPKVDAKWVQTGADIIDILYKVAISAAVVLDGL
ncbi:MAG: polysaccharide biosynthesis/export family protein [Woeseiaceae bacterium]|nr:polysaccharide biosynthesis/export family protein [Woeseiaceae bacterium]